MKYHAPFGSADPEASYVDKNVPGAVRGSPVPAKAIEDPQRELVDLIKKSGLDPSDTLQLANAIQTGKINVAQAAGTANAITATLSPAPVSLSEGMVIMLKVQSANTGAATLNLNGLGVLPITGPGGGALNSGDLQPGFVKIVYSGAAWLWMGRQRGQLLNIRTYSAAGTSTYTPTPGTRSVEVEVQAAGGAGGGAAPTGSTQVSAGAGGGAGGYARKYISSGFSGVTITVGAGGAASAGVAGGSGGSSSFGTHVSATGGFGGTLGAALVPSGTTVVGNGAAGAGANGDVNANGGVGKYAVYQTSQLGGEGGASFFGGGGAPSSGTSSGFLGVSPGSGGGGGNLGNSNASAAAGGKGADGLVRIWEYA